MYEGIISGIFDWDYGPASVMMFEGRQFINISQEGEDDINDLRELGLVEGLKLSTAKHRFITAYQINAQGLETLEYVDPAHKKAVETLIHCPNCNRQLMVDTESECLILCPHCQTKQRSQIMDIEDVSYVSKPYLPTLPRVRIRPEAGK